MSLKFIFLFILTIFAPFFAYATNQIDINAASLAQLDELAGIGPVYAQRIIDARPFSSVDDLVRVSGIGDKTLQKIKEQGLACVNCGEVRPPEPKSGEVGLPAGSPTSGAEGAALPSGIFINEIMPNPEGPDETNEWIELYNSNNFEIDLSGWQIKDSTGSTNTFTIPTGTKIMANGFKFFSRPETKIMLNNDEDGLNLLTPDGKIMDSMGFVSAPLGRSYNKTSSDWTWSTTLTPGSKNLITAPIVKSSSKALPKTQKTDNNIVEAEDLTASLSQNSNPWFLFFTVLVATLILAAITLFIKFKF